MNDFVAPLGVRVALPTTLSLHQCPLQQFAWLEHLCEHSSRVTNRHKPAESLLNLGPCAAISEEASSHTSRTRPRRSGPEAKSAFAWSLSNESHRVKHHSPTSQSQGCLSDPASADLGPRANPRNPITRTSGPDRNGPKLFHRWRIFITTTHVLSIDGRVRSTLPHHFIIDSAGAAYPPHPHDARLGNRPVLTEFVAGCGRCSSDRGTCSTS